MTDDPSDRRAPVPSAAPEQRSRDSEERFHHLVDAAVDYAIFMLDENGVVATWNTGASRIKGYEASAIIGQHFSVFYTAEDRAKGRPAWILSQVRQNGRFEDEGWRLRRDGSRFWANVVITAVRSQSGEIVGFAKVTRDLTARREAEEQLRRSEQRFRLLIEGVTDYAIYMLDPYGRVDTWNHGAERLKGYRAEEILGQHFSIFFGEEDVRLGRPQRELAAARAQGRFEDEGWRIRKDGSRFWANVVVTALFDSQQQFIGFAKVTRDLTARRRADETERRLLVEQAQREAAEDLARQAEESNRLKDEFLATVSHELRTPLTAILGWSTLLRERGREPALVARALEAIHRNAEAQSRIVDDLLDVSQIVAGKLRLETRPTDLVEVVGQALDVVRPSALAKNLTLEFNQPKLDCLLVGDPERLQQIVWNLLSNAVKFTDAGGSIRVALERTSSELVLSVQDTGIGITPEFLPHVFARFTQADGSTTRRAGGLGLGLAIVRHLTELHGGSVQVSSPGPGEGARFSVRLPLIQPTATVLEPAASAPASLPRGTGALQPAALAGRRILLVDDQPETREIVQTLLETAGASVEATASAAEAYDRLPAFRPHVIVSDLAMPDEDGYSLMKRVRHLPPELGAAVPAIALTAYTRGQDRTRALAAGFTTYLTKPINPNELLAAIENLVRLSPTTS